MIDGGKTPILELSEVEKLGFMSVGFVLTGMFASAKAMDSTFKHLMKFGSSSKIKNLMTFNEFTSILGLEEKYNLDERYTINLAYDKLNNTGA